MDNGSVEVKDKVKEKAILRVGLECQYCYEISTINTVLHSSNKGACPHCGLHLDINIETLQQFLVQFDTFLISHM